MASSLFRGGLNLWKASGLSTVRRWWQVAEQLELTSTFEFERWRVQKPESTRESTGTDSHVLNGYVYRGDRALATTSELEGVSNVEARQCGQIIVLLGVRYTGIMSIQWRRGEMTGQGWYG